jgi:CBS domain-containing protein
MTAPVRTIGSSESACMASMHLVDRSIGCLPVVDAGRLVGIVTEADLLRTFLARIANGDSVPSRDPGTVEDHMTASPRTVHWYTTIGDATAICRSNGFRHLPVIEAGVLAGFLSDRDLRKAAGLSRQADTPVDEIMTRDVETISPLASMSDAATIMLQRRFSALPVVSDDEVVGILTMADVLDACLTAFDTGDEAAHPTHTG